MLTRDLVNSFTTHLRNVLARSIDLAWERHQPTIPPLYLLVSLSEQTESVGSQFLSQHRMPKEIFMPYLSEKKPTARMRTPGNTAETFLWPEFSEQAKRMLHSAARVATEFHHEYVGTHHLLYVLLRKPDRQIQLLLQEHDIPLSQLHAHLLDVLETTPRAMSHKETNELSGVRTITELADVPLSSPIAVTAGHDLQESETPALDFFGRDLTLPDTAAMLDPVIGRAEEIDRIIQILLRRTKNNPVLIGEPGVGKTAIVEGIAKKIVAGDVPPVLQDKRIIALDFSLILAGSIYRGEFESRLKQIIDEVQNHPDIIVFIDEIHLIVGTGGNGTSATMDAANIFKPPLARGEMRCIGATTTEEYRASIESDAALCRRFQSLLVREPTPEESVMILRGLRKQYEKFHHIHITDDAIHSAVKLSQELLPDRRLPDKALDLLDEAGARLASRRVVPKPVRTWQRLDRELSRIYKEQEQALRHEQFELVGALKQQTQRLLSEKRALEPLLATTTIPQYSVQSEDIADIVTAVTGIPRAHVAASSSATSTYHENVHAITERIIGQDHVIMRVLQLLKRSFVGLTAPNRPMGSFLFFGPSGVGKTELARVFADVLFGGSDHLLAMNMSEFSESFHVTKFLGAPAGYVGYNEGVKFIEHIRRKPSSVVLFDEIEKAHPDILNILLQILDEGNLTDARGREINFRSSIIILTSNIGAEFFGRQQTMGFATNEKGDTPADATIKNTLLREAKEIFPAELFQRLHDTLIFRQLTQKDIEQIVARRCDDVVERLRAKGMNVRIDASVRKFLATESYDAEHGARRIERQCIDHLEDPIADHVLKENLQSGDAMVVTYTNKKIVVKNVHS